MHKLYKSTGFWRLEFTFQTMEWALPFSYTHGVGGLTFGILCFQATYWRGDFRYEPAGIDY
jgi:hypothetical protein